MNKLLTTMLATVFAAATITPVFAADTKDTAKTGAAKVQSKSAMNKAEGAHDNKAASKASAASVKLKSGMNKSEGANDRSK